MFTFKFTPNSEFAAQAAQAQATRTIQQLQQQADKSFTLALNNRQYPLRYEITPAGEVSIYHTGSQSLTTPVLQLNIGDMLLPEYIDLGVVQAIRTGGLNPQVTQQSVYESDARLATETAKAIMDEIRRIGLLNIILRKSSSK